MLIKRRGFLQLTSLASASVLMPKFLQALTPAASLAAGNKVVVVLQFSGGNDGLNTIIPVRNDIYYRSRPVLALKSDKALRLNDEAGIHPALPAFRALYDNGELAILNSVGYPEPNRSHFRSMDIWHSGSASADTWTTGWLGRYLDEKCNNCDKPTQALELDDTLSLAMKGEWRKAIAVRDPKRLMTAADQKLMRSLSAQKHAHEHESPASYLYQTMTETVNSAEYIFRQSKLHAITTTFPDSELGRSFRIISSLIGSDINTKVYYLNIGSFDTHVNQQGQQHRLFTEINVAVEAFVNEMKLQGRFQDVMLMTFSEFGRRVAQNGSGGTDHGTANNMFFIGGGLKEKGMLNALPDLSNLEEGDLRFQVDFKSVYATILDRWLDTPHASILHQTYPTLQFI